ncbi:MAG: hypothetical protein ACK4M2_11295 [Brevundimonas sp.]
MNTAFELLLLSLAAKAGRRDVSAPVAAPSPIQQPAATPAPYRRTGSMPLSPRDFLDLVQAWAGANVPRIRNVWPLQGGWEAWAQAEIAAFVNADDRPTWIMRESRAYPDNSRADFLVNDPFQNEATDEIVVEMKCESLGNWDAFVDGLRYDVYKLQGDLGMGLNPAQRMVLGIFFSPESEAKLAQLAGFTITYTPDREVGIASMVWQNP